MIRRFRPGGNSPVIVQGEENLRILMPGWMLDEGYCRMLVVEDRPRVSVDALVRLRAVVVGMQELRAGGGNDGCAWLMANEDSHEPPTIGPKAGADRAPGNT